MVYGCLNLISDNLKECFFRALDQRLPKLHDLRLLLSSIVKYINDKLIKKEISLRQPLSEQVSSNIIVSPLYNLSAFEKSMSN